MVLKCVEMKWKFVYEKNVSVIWVIMRVSYLIWICHVKVVSEVWFNVDVVNEKRKCSYWWCFSIVVECRYGFVLWRIEEAWTIVKDMVWCEKNKKWSFCFIYEEYDMCGWWWKGKVVWDSSEEEYMRCSREIFVKL